MATPTPPTPTPAALAAQAVGQSNILRVLNDAKLVLSVLTGVGPVIPGVGLAIAGGAALGLELENLFAAVYTAHLAIVGKPLDLTTLQPYIPVP